MFGAPNAPQTGANPSGTLGGGFSFGAAASAQPKPTGFALPTPSASNTSVPATGLNLSTSAAKAGGLSFGAATPATSTAPGLSALLNSTTTGSTGFSLGGLGATTTAGFSLGGAAPASTAAGFSLGGTPAATATTGLSLGGASTGFALGGTTKPSTTGFNLGGTTTNTGLPLGGSTGVGFGGGLGAAAPKTTLSFGPSTGAATLSLGQPAASGTGIFGNSSLTTSSSLATNRGLGGQDPKTSTSGASTTGAGGKDGDSKVVKESFVPPEIVATVENFEKYVREQKSIRENIARMSSKSLYKVQEDITSLRQMISSVKNKLQRNAVCIEKLKRESSQELKHAEIAQRTKDTPPGLQYENTAPAEYFSGLIDEFETQMIAYRQQIEEMESHLTSLSQEALLTPQELSLLLRKLYESFVALAAQLQAVHEAVMMQKEQYLNYRRVLHNDTTDIFEKRKRVQDATGCSIITSMPGPTPFARITNPVANAMATSLNRPQQPAAVTLGSTYGAMGPSTQFGGGLFGSATGFGFGSSAFKPTPTTTASTGFGLGTGLSFGNTATASNTATVAPLGGGASAFGASLSAPPSGGFGAPNTSFGAAGSFAQQSPFQLGKPPAGNKRTKKT